MTEDITDLIDAISEEPLYKEFVIPKKSGKDRKICAPNKTLASMQRGSLKALYQHYKKYSSTLGVQEIVHGFIPGKNVVTAAQKHVGFDSTTMMDISNFFDSITKEHVKMFITNPEKFWFHKDGYTAQGFCTSPILAAISTLGMVKAIDGELLKEFGLGGYAFTIYADDLQVSINNPSPARIKKILDIITIQVEEMGLKLNPSKTRTRFAKHGYRRILGVNVGKDHYRATRKTMRKIRAARHGGNKSSLGGLVNWSNCNLPKQKK